MAGPNYIHYNTTTNIVVQVNTTSMTPAGGNAEVFESHPDFIPPPGVKRWIRTGVGSYTLTNIDSRPEYTVTEFNGIVNVVITGDSHVSWGSLGGLADILISYTGKILAGSVTAAQTRTAGTCELFFTINGIIQNTVSAFATLDGTNTLFVNSVLFTPIDFVAGDHISVVAVTDNFTPTPQSLTISLTVEMNNG